MTYNTIFNLRVSKAEASDRILSRIHVGEQLLDTEISTEQGLTNFIRATQKWVDYNKRLCSTLFTIPPLPDMHGTITFLAIDASHRFRLLHEIAERKRYIANWMKDLERICDRLKSGEYELESGEYEELPNNAQQTTRNDTMSNNTTRNENKKIFIGHGGSHVWREFKDFIVETLELDYEEFNRISAVGKPTSERLKEMLEESSIAIIIMTGEDEQADGSLRARENVIHEIGLFQGKLGFEQTIILLEDGCKDFSNIHGITHIPFPKGEIEATFGRIF